MAENGNGRRGGEHLDFSTDTPVPAAEVLIDLKESARRRRVQERVLRASPRRRKNAAPSPRRNSSKNSHRREASNDSSGLHNSPSEEEEEEGGGDGFREAREEEEGGGRRWREMEDGMSESEGEGKPPQKKIKRVMRPRTGKTQADTRQDQATLVTLHSVSSRLRNLLKLPKAHKWCYYEWFYSDVDQPLLEGENDFCRCLSEMFPELKTHNLTRVQWRYIRRLMGKPRRCSPTFFSEERALLEHRRRRVRTLQQQVHQGTVTGPDFAAAYKEVPDYIPQLLVVGTPVTARLHTWKESGFYTGRIEAVDLDNHQYWVTFDRPGLGKHSVPDTEIKAATSPEFICVSKLEASHQSHWHRKETNSTSSTNPAPAPAPPPPPSSSSPAAPTPSSVSTSLPPATPPRPILADSTSNVQLVLSPELLPDPFLTSSPERRKLLSEPQRLPGTGPPKPVIPERVGGFPVDFLRQVMQLSKLLSLKQQITSKLAHMNTEAEKAHARQKPLGSDFQRRYAILVVDLDDMNKQLNMRLDAIRGHCESMGYGSDINPPHMDVREQATKITESANNSLETSGSEVKDPRVIGLITKLTGLLLQIEALSESANSLQVNTLSKSVEEISHSIQPANRSYFRDSVETPVTFIQSGMSPVGTLHAFSATARPTGTAHHRHFKTTTTTSGRTISTTNS